MSKITLVVIGVCMLWGLLKDQPKKKNPFLSGGGGDGGGGRGESNDQMKLLKTLQSLMKGEDGKEGMNAIMDLVQRGVVDGLAGANVAGALMGLVKPEEIHQAHKAVMVQQILGDVEKQLASNDNQTASKAAVARILTGLLAMDCGLAKRAEAQEAKQCEKDGACHVV